MKEVIEYWEVTESFDRDTKHIANFTNEEAATSVANSIYRSVNKRIFVVFDTEEEFLENTRDKLRERALAKLTAEERNALGFK